MDVPQDSPLKPRSWEDSAFRIVLEGAPDAIVMVDGSGSIVLVNQQAENMFGYSRSEMLTRRIEMLVPARYQDAHIVTRKDYLQAPETRPMGADLELYALCQDGTELPVEISLSPVRLENEIFIVSTIRDISARIRAAQELKRLNADLIATNRELEAFTYSISHDLRAPVRHIESFSRLLSEEYQSALDGAGKHYLERISSSTLLMGTLIDSLLGMARLGRRELQLEIVGLTSVVQEVRRELAPESEGRQVHWEIGDLPYAQCDATLIKQVFANLLANALKFTRPREKASIQVGYGPTERGPAVFVRDNGVGFSMKYADKLFGVFQRLHRVQDFEGTGAGLAIVQRIIHKHRGEIWAAAELNVGATFYFTLADMEK